MRTALQLPLGDQLAVTRKFLNSAASHSGLGWCLRRHGVSNLKTLQPKATRPTVKAFKAHEPGFVHIDVKYLPAFDGESRCYLLVAIGRATRGVFIG